MSIYEEKQIPFVYVIGWSELNKFYIGCRFAKNVTPKSLWTTYFTSSKIVKTFREEFGEPDVIGIRKTFRTVEECIRYEATLIRRMGAHTDKRFLNRSCWCIISKRMKFESKAGKTYEDIYGKDRVKEQVEKRRIGISRSCKVNKHNSGKRNPKAKDWVLVTPTNEVIHIKHLTEIAKENNLSIGELYAVARGTIRQHKMWMCFEKRDFDPKRLNEYIERRDQIYQNRAVGSTKIEVNYFGIVNVFDRAYDVCKFYAISSFLFRKIAYEKDTYIPYRYVNKRLLGMTIRFI